MQKLYVENDSYETFEERGNRKCNFVYAHGNLQHEAGFDLLRYEGVFDYAKDRIERVVAVLPSGKECDSILFLWHSDPYDERCAKLMKENPILNCHGLLVANNDKEAMIDALRKCIRRASCI